MTAPNSHRVARRALQRERASQVLRRSGRMLVWASGLAVAAGVPVGIWGGGEAGLWVVGSLLGAGLVAGAGLALAKPRRLVSAAANVDEVLRLEDRLSSALELESARHAEDSVFSQLAVRDAERRAAEVRVAQAVPVRFTRDWMLWPVLSAAAVAGVLLIPPLVRQSNQPSPGEIARARDSIIRASQAVDEQLRTGQGAGEAADDETLARLEDIERELTEGRSTPERARTESAAALEERARELEAEARREEEQLTQALREIEPDPESGVSDLAEALRRSDFESASEQLRELARAAQAMDDASREALAEDLRRLAEQIRQAEQRNRAAEATLTESERSDVAERPSPDEPPAARPDVPEVTEPGAAQPEPPAAQPPERALEEQDVGSESPQPASQEAPRDPGDQVAGQDEDRSPGEELSDRLDDMAEQIKRDPQSLEPDQPEPKPGENGKPDPQSPEGRPGQPERQGEGPLGEQSGQQPPPSGAPESARPQSGQEQPGGEKPAPGERQPPGQEQTQEGPSEEGPAPESGKQPKPGEQTPPGAEGQPSREESGDAGQKPEEGAQEQPTPRPGQQTPGAPPASEPGQQGQPGAEQRQGGEQAPGEQPAGESKPTGPESLQPGTESGDEQSNEQQGQGGSLREMLDQLEKMDQRKLEALRKMARSEKLREAAQELLDNASAEDLDRLRNLAGRFGREPLFDERPPTEEWQPETEFFDARGLGADENIPSRVVGAAEGTSAGRGQSIAGASRAEVAERFRDAAAGVERAIEGQSIPPRMRNYVRSVYRRFEESAGRPPVQEGRDADAPSSD